MQWLAMLRPLVPLFIIAALCVLAHWQGVRGENRRLTNKHAAELARVIADVEARRADAERRARTAEQRHAADMATVAADHQRKDDDAKREIERLDAAVRAGTVRLRERFTCPGSSLGGGVPTAGSAAGRSDAAEGRGLRDEDALAFVRLADEADAVTRQLQACQEVVRRDRDGR